MHSRLAVRMYSRAEHCRRRGLEAQQQAARTTEKRIGDAFEDVAEGWFELAELMDRLDRHSEQTRTDAAQKRPGSVPTARR